MPRKWCFIDSCSSTSYRCPNKIFITVPRNINRRERWFLAAGRKLGEVSSSSTLYCCEDHFNLEEDMENYWEYKMSKVAARMKKDIVPRIYSLQAKRKRIINEKNERKRIVEELLNEKSTNQKSILEEHLYSKTNVKFDTSPAEIPLKIEIKEEPLSDPLDLDPPPKIEIIKIENNYFYE